MNDILSDFRMNAAFVDYKTQFQELVQKRGEQNIKYKVVKETGPTTRLTWYRFLSEIKCLAWERAQQKGGGTERRQGCH